MNEGWEIKKLGDIATFSQGIQVGLKLQENRPMEGYVRFIRIIDYTQNTDDVRYVKNPGEKYIVAKDDIVMVRYGTPGLIGRGKEGAIANNLFKITINQNGITNNYLSLYLSQHKIQKFLGSQGSATMPALNFRQLKTVDVLFPISIEEQKEIVEILDQAFEAIDKAKANIKKNIENAKELLLSQREIFFDKLSFDKSSQIKPLNDLCLKIFAGGDKPKDFSKIKTLKQNIPVIANAVKNNGIYGYTETPVVKGNSVTVAARGSGTGHVEFRDYDYFPVVRLIVLIPDNDLINEKFLMTALKNLKVRSSGSAIPQLTVPMIKTYSIAAPNLEKQKEIVETLDIIDNHIQSLLTSYEEELKNLEELKKSILQKAFSGELTNKNKAA